MNYGERAPFTLFHPKMCIFNVNTCNTALYGETTIFGKKSSCLECIVSVNETSLLVYMDKDSLKAIHFSYKMMYLSFKSNAINFQKQCHRLSIALLLYCESVENSFHRK